MTLSSLLILFALAVTLVVLSQMAVVVPQQKVFLVERLGRFRGSLQAGFHVLLPFVDVVSYRLSLKELALDVAEQVCITRDNVQVSVDGVLYLKVMNPERAAYGVSDYTFAIVQLAQTTLRSEIGKIDLDRTFEERTRINTALVMELDKASEAWGIKVLRYELKNIAPPRDVLAAMEKQMRAEREKRATVLTSEGERDARINAAEGHKQQMIKESEGKRQSQVNEADGAAQAIFGIAKATAAGLQEVALASQAQGAKEAMSLRLAEAYIQQFGAIAKASTTLVVPANAADPASMLATASRILQAASTVTDTDKLG
jgi:regulator of protease activity HflC (stomatin/prohibitin superfamily)